MVDSLVLNALYLSTHILLVKAGHYLLLSLSRCLGLTFHYWRWRHFYNVRLASLMCRATKIHISHIIWLLMVLLRIWVIRAALLMRRCLVSLLQSSIKLMILVIDALLTLLVVVSLDRFLTLLL